MPMNLDLVIHVPNEDKRKEVLDYLKTEDVISNSFVCLEPYIYVDFTEKIAYYDNGSYLNTALEQHSCVLIEL